MARLKCSVTTLLLVVASLGCKRTDSTALSNAPSERAPQLLVWQPEAGAARIILPNFDHEDLPVSVSRYVDALTRDSDTFQALLLESEFSPKDLVLSVDRHLIQEFDAVKERSKPRILLLANLLEDMVNPARFGARIPAEATNGATPIERSGDRVHDIIRQLSALGMDVYLAPLRHDVGLSPDKIEAYLDLLTSNFHGVLAMGGTDWTPALYGAVPTYAQDPVPERDDSELDLWNGFFAAKSGPRMFGICRGSQLCAISQGYRLIQDIPAHRTKHRQQSAVTHSDGYHDVHVEEQSWLGRTLRAERLKSPINVYTYHHQALDPDGAKNRDALIFTAKADDGIVEATQTPDERMVCFQFHPELMEGTAVGQAILRGIAETVRTRFLAGDVQ